VRGEQTRARVAPHLDARARLRTEKQTCDMLGAVREGHARKRPCDDAEFEGEGGAKHRHDARPRKAARKADEADGRGESGAVDGSAAEIVQGRDQGMTTTYVARGGEDTSGVARATGETPTETARKTKQNEKKMKQNEKKMKKKEKKMKNLSDEESEDPTWSPERVDEEESTEDENSECEEDISEANAHAESDEDSASGHLARWRNVTVDESLGVRRKALEEPLKQAIKSVGTSKIHAHQRAAAILMVERFCSGSPGCLFVLDCGLGKTHCMLSVAGALIQVGVRVVVASENLLVSECKRIFADLWPELEPDALEVIVSGHQPIHKAHAKDAFAQRAQEDAVFIVDEASRYSDEEGAMHTAISESVANGYRPFNILVTATPFTSTFSKLGSLVCLTGIGERDEFKKKFEIAARAFVTSVQSAAVDEIGSSELSEFLDEITIGRRVLEKLYPEMIQTLVKDINNRVRMQVRVLTIPTRYSEQHWNAVLAAIATKCPMQLLDIVTKCELSETLAFAFSQELGLEPAQIGADENIDATVQAIIDLVLSMAQQGVVVYVPSDLAAGAWYIWARLVAILGPAAVAVIDQDTSRDERQRIIATFDMPNDERQYKVLLATTQTSGFGINLPTVDNAILLTSSWTASTNAQATHRNVRAFANANEVPRLKRLVVVMMVTNSGSLAISRLSRAAFRGKCGASLFPPLFPIDESYNLPILATTETPLTVEKRNAIAGKISDLATDGIVLRDYSDFLSSMAKLASPTTSIEFLFGGDNKQREKKPRKKVDQVDRAATSVQRGARATSNGSLNYKNITAKNESVRAVLAGIATSHAVPTLAPEVVARSIKQALCIQEGIARAQSSLERGETWRPSTSDRYEWLFRKTTRFDAPERSMMLTASSLSSFPTGPIQQTPQMRAGVELEANALKHIAKKYDFEMVANIDEWSRALPSEPTYLAATLDGLTTTGIIVEVKFVHNFMDILTPAGATKKFNRYVNQVQAQLCVFELPLAMLVFYSKDASSGDMFSCEYWIHRDDDWLDRNKDLFDSALARQRAKFAFDPSSL